MSDIYDIFGNPIAFDGGGDDDDTTGLEDLLSDRLLIWHDEFNKPEIDRTKWSNVYSRDYAENLDLVANSNNGLQYRAIRDYRLGSSAYAFSCPFLQTNGLFEFKYGRIEVKMKFPEEGPHHSTFWTLGANFERLSVADGVTYDETKGVLFPSCGEIDIAELDHRNGVAVGARMHWSSEGLDSSGGYETGGTMGTLNETPFDWHIYSCEWTETGITFYCDGRLKGATWAISNADVDGYNPFKHPHFLIFNNVPATSGTPQWDIAETQVAWVRVYAPVGVTEKIVETAISIPSTASITVGERSWLGTPTFTPSNPSDMTVKWLSHNDDIVTCHGGMLIGVSEGQTYVQAISKHGYTSLCKVTVTGS